MYRIAVGKNVETTVFLVLIKRIEIFRHQTAQRRTALADEKNTVAVAVVDLHHARPGRTEHLDAQRLELLAPFDGVAERSAFAARMTRLSSEPVTVKEKRSANGG